jgi:F-type H+-transporting ATPase subunit beta
MPQNIGKVVQIAGPAVDVQFTEAGLPPIYEALQVTSEGFNVPAPISVILEVQQHLGEGRVRCVAMQATDGMVRGMKAIDLGGPISVPVGQGHAGPRDQRNWRAGGPAWSGVRYQEAAHPSPGAFV